MRKLVICLHVSADGFVAGPNGEMDWIHVDDEIFDYAGYLTDEADTALYGRITYEMMDSYWPTAADQPGASKHDIQHSTWYNSVNKVVLSKMLKGNLEKTRFVNENINEEIKKLKEKDGKNILMFGSPTAVHSLMEFNLIDEYWMFVNPVILGEGKKMFDSVREKINLTLVEAKSFAAGVVGLHYKKA
ncbi:MAG: dihydrofolate reductase family protein [Ginsengibacter sp.]